MADKNPTAYEFGRYRLSGTERVLTRDGKPVSLTPKAVDTLLALVEKCGHIVTRKQLTKEVWPDTYVGEDSLTRNISALRKALGNGDGESPLIETLSKRGYRFAGTVRAVTDTGPSGVVVPLDGEKSIAVLPFATTGGTEAEMYLAAGVADALIGRLTRIPGILVRPTSAVLRYSGSTDDASEVRAKLRVSLVLKGTIRRDGDRMRVSAQLVNLEREVVLWAETFHEQFTDIFSVEDAIARQVADALMPRMHGALPLLVRRPVNTEAYEAYVRGRYFWNRATGEGYTKAVECYSQAIAIDPDYAPAHAGLADCFNMFGFWWVMPPNVAFPQAEAHARRALELDDSLGEAHTALAWARLHYHYDRDGAQALFTRAIELNPGYVIGRQWYGLFHAQAGRFDRAFDEMRHALALDPLALVANYNLGVLLMLSQQLDEAIAQFQHTIELDPKFPMAHAHLGFTYALKGMPAEAWAANNITKAISDPVLNLVSVAMFHAMFGNQNAARAALDEFNGAPNKPYALPMMIAQVHAALGDADRTIEWLEKDYEERDPWLMWLKMNPLFDGVRADSRIQQILTRIGLG